MNIIKNLLITREFNKNMNLKKEKNSQKPRNLKESEWKSNRIQFL